MNDSKNINVVEIMKNIHREADEIFGKDIEENAYEDDIKKIRTIDFRNILRLEGEEFIDAIYSEVFAHKADEDALNRHLEALKSGKSKDSIIRDIMNSEKALNTKVTYYGLKEYDASDILQYDDLAFINNLYFKLLMRSPDESGAKRYLYRLQSGLFSKEEMIWIFVSSAEGQKAGVSIAGLSKAKILKKKIIRHLPLFNKLFEYKMALSFSLNSAEEMRELKEENEKLKDEIENLRNTQQRNYLMISRQLERLEQLRKDN